MSRQKAEIAGKGRLVVDATAVIERIYKVADAMGIRNRKEIAERMGRSVSLISNILTGGRSLSTETVLKAARGFDVPYRWLLTGEGAPPAILAPGHAALAKSVAGPVSVAPDGSVTVLRITRYLCGRCRGDVPQGATVCLHCGAKLDWPPEESQPGAGEGLSDPRYPSRILGSEPLSVGLEPIPMA